MSQTTIKQVLDIGFPGMLSDTAKHDVVTRISAEVSAEMPFGIAVAEGTGDQDALLLASADDLVVGVVLHSHMYSIDSATSPGDLGTTGLKPKAVLNILRQGRVLVLLEQDVAKGDPVFVRWLANGAGKLQVGAFRKDDDTAHAIDLSKQAQYVRAGVSGGIGEVEINMSSF